MNPLVIGLIVFVCVYGATLFGLWLRRVLPEAHLNDESREVIKVVTGMIATVSAMVLGLLVASAKNSYDTINDEFRQTATQVVLIDRVLAQYGPEAGPVRDLLRRAYAKTIDQVFSSDAADRARLIAPGSNDSVEDVENMVRQLAPTNEAQRGLQSRALQLAGDLARTRWLLVAQAGSSLSVPLLVVLVSWLSAIFASFGLFAPRNATALTALFIGALAVSTAIFLIEELDRPLSGVLRMSPAPMRNALDLLGK
jgi:hypothetical protein